MFMIKFRFRVSRVPLLAAVFVSLAAGCATNQKSRLAMTVSSFAVGAAAGYGTAPEDERKEMHAVYWGGLLGVAAAVASNYIYDDETEVEKVSLENEKLKAQLDLIQNANKVLVKQGKGKFKGSGGEEFQSGTATWKLYQTDQWVKDGPTRMYHQDKMIEIISDRDDKK